MIKCNEIGLDNESSPSIATFTLLIMEYRIEVMQLDRSNNMLAFTYDEDNINSTKLDFRIIYDENEMSYSV